MDGLHTEGISAVIQKSGTIWRSSIETARQKQAAYISGDNILIDGENINGAALYTIDGRLVMSISSHHNTIDISDLTPGYYIFKAIIDNNPVSLKLRK